MARIDDMTPEDALAEFRRRRSIKNAKQKMYNAKRKPEDRQRELKSAGLRQAYIRRVHKWVRSQPELLARFDAQDVQAAQEAQERYAT